MKLLFEKYHRLIFASVAIFLLYPTFQKGYVFLLDWKMLVNFSLPDINWKVDSVGRILYYFIVLIFSFGVLQRIFLFGIIFFLGVAGFRLTKRTNDAYARYFAGLFLIFNPFIYARLVEQPGIALGSLLFFWFLIYLLEYLEENKKNRKKIIAASVFAGLAVSMLAHSIFFIALSAAVILFFDFIKNRDLKLVLKTAAIILGILLLVNFNWILGGVTGANDRISAIKSFGSEDWDAFRTRSIGGNSVYFTVLALQGYWGEYQDRFVSVQENPLWEIAFYAIFFLAIFGLYKRWKENDYFAKALFVAAIAAYILAIGVASPIIEPLAIFLFKHVPFYIGLRESQKWAAVLLFAYAYLSAWGVRYFLQSNTIIIKNHAKDWGIALAILPVVFSFSMFGGTLSHFTPHEFPDEWYEAKNELAKNDFKKILFFPWHSYMKFDFAEKNVFVPAQGFFGKNVIQARNTEFGRIYSHSGDVESLTVEKYVFKKDNPEEKINYADFSDDMKKIGIQSVMLSKTEDWKKYLWLDTIGLQKIVENKKLIIYKL